MRIRWTILLAMAALSWILPARGGRADEVEVFEEAYKAWQGLHKRVQTATVRARSKAARENRKFTGQERNEIRRRTYEAALQGMDDSPGARPVLRRLRREVYEMRLGAGDDPEATEKLIRENWEGWINVDRQPDYRVLWNAYRRAKKYADAVRIAEEALERYGWEWESRQWKDRIIDAAFEDPALHAKMVKGIDAFADDHLEELGAADLLNKYLRYLTKLERWEQGARLVDECLEEYTNSDWEPAFLVHGIVIHSNRYSALVDAKTGAAKAERPEEKAYDKDAKDSGKTALILAKRAVERCPYAPETSRALLHLFRWGQAEGKRNEAVETTVAAGIADYLRDHPGSMYWVHLATLGRGYDTQDWKTLAEGIGPAREAEKERNELVNLRIRADKTNLAGYILDLKDFVLKYPETDEARQAIRPMVQQVGRQEAALFAEKSFPDIKEAIEKGFPTSPVFRSRALQDLADALTYRYADDIYEDLIDDAENDIQEEWYYYRQAMRYTRGHGYNVEYVKDYMGKYKESFYVPDVVRVNVSGANYNNAYHDSTRLCEELAEKRYMTSLGAMSLLSGAVEWSRRGLRHEAQNDRDKYYSNGQLNRNYDKLVKRRADMAEDWANLVHRYGEDRFPVSAVFFHARVWGEEVRFKGEGKDTGEEILLEEPWKTTYHGLYYRMLLAR